MLPPSGPNDASPRNCAVHRMLCSRKLLRLSRRERCITSQNLLTLHQRRCGHKSEPVAGEVCELFEPTANMLAELSDNGKHCMHNDLFFLYLHARVICSLSTHIYNQYVPSSQPQLTNPPGNRHHSFRNRARARTPPLRSISPSNPRHQPSAKGQHPALHRLRLAERRQPIEIPGHPDIIRVRYGRGRLVTFRALRQ